MSRHKKPKENKKGVKPNLAAEVLDTFKHNNTKLLNYRQISAFLEINDEPERLMIIEIMEVLKDKGLISEKEPGKFQYKETENYVNGTIDFITSGAAYVVVSLKEEDIYIPKGKTKDALQGDTVKVQVTFIDKRKREGVVAQVIQRKRTDFVGIAQVNGKNCFIVPDSTKLHVDFFIPQIKTKGVINGQKALIKLTNWNPTEVNPIGEVIEILGFPGVHATEMNAIMAEYGLPEHFPTEIEEAAKNIPTEITEEEINKRRDFRDVTTFTIDPHDAKDFDDAISFKKLDNGNIEIGVHIADVTHYVKPKSIIDVEGLERATSVYLVDRVIPMLPEVLSNFVCSLRPKEEKLCFAAVFEMDENAGIIKEWFGRTVIYSDRRFAYEEVQKIIETKKGDFLEEILILDSLAKKLRNRRMRDGSLFFDKEEVKFHLDETGKPTGVYFKIQQDAHKLIEDFMLLANRQVASLLGLPEKGKRQKPPSVYRVHDTPSNDKLSDLSNFVSKFGYGINITNKKSITQSLNKLLLDVKGKPEAGTIEILTIRSMPKAVYTTKNIGHYGLGFDYYTHFTSPIRRYPDMMVHRLLEAHLEGRTYSKEDELESFCKHSSDNEKVAAEAERASIKYKQVEFLMDKIGQVFEGVISGVTEWGIYVEILENKCEGMVRTRDMKDDFYTFDADNYRYVGKRTSNTYCLGDKVLIEVKTADMIKKQLSFAFVETLEKNKSQAISEKHEGHRGKEGHHRGKKNKYTNKKNKRRR